MIGTVVGGLTVMALLAAGCSSSAKGAGRRARPRGAATTTSTTGITNAVPISSGEAQVIVGSATGNSPCEKAAPTPASPGQVGAGGGGGEKANVLAGEHGARGMVVQKPITQAQRMELQQQMMRGARGGRVPHRQGRRSGRLLPVDGVRAVHRRALHERSPRDLVRPGAPVGVVVRRFDSRREDRRVELPRVSPQRSPARIRGAQRSLAPAQRERRALHGSRRSDRRRRVVTRSARRSAATRRC